MGSRIDTTPAIEARLLARESKLVEQAGTLPRAASELQAVRQHLTELRSTPAKLRQEQIDFYGVVSWSQKFQLAGTLDHVGGLRPKGEALRLYLWKLLDHSRFRSVGEAFAHLDHRVLPSFSVGRGGTVQYAFRKPDLNRGSLLAVVIDPDLIGNELLQKLGICDFDAMRGDPLARWRAKWSLRTVTLLKGVLEAAHPLVTGRGERVVQIGELSAAALGKYEPFADDLADILRERQGRLLVTQQSYRRQGELEVPYRTVSYFDGLFPASRRPKHIASGHDAEMEQLSLIEAEVRSLLPSVERWGKLSVEGKLELQNTARKTGAACLKLLEGVEHPLKRSTRRLIELAHEIKDSRGRANPSTALNELHRALLALRTRQVEVSTIKGFVSTDDRALQTEAMRSHVALRLFAERLVAASHQLSQDAAGTAGGSRNGVTIADAFLLRHRLGVETISLSGVEPYRTVQAVIAAGIIRLKASMVDDSAVARRVVKGLYALALMDGVQQHIEGIRTELISRQPTPHEFWRGAVRMVELSQQISQRLQNGIQVTPVQERLQAMFEAAAALRNRIAGNGTERTAWRDAEERRTVEADFKAVADGMSLEAIAIALEVWFREPGDSE